MNPFWNHEPKSLSTIAFWLLMRQHASAAKINRHVTIHADNVAPLQVALVCDCRVVGVSPATGRHISDVVAAFPQRIVDQP